MYRETRTKNGMLGSFPLGLLTPTIPCCSIQSIHKELRVMGIEFKIVDDQNSIRLRMIFFKNREIIKKEPKEMD